MSYINRQDFRVLFLQEIIQYLWNAVNNFSCGGIANYLNYLLILYQCINGIIFSI